MINDTPGLRCLSCSQDIELGATLYAVTLPDYPDASYPLCLGCSLQLFDPDREVH